MNDDKPKFKDVPPTENAFRPFSNQKVDLSLPKIDTINDVKPKFKDFPPMGNAFPRHPFSNQKVDLSYPKYRLHCQSTNNNTIITFTKPNGATLAWQSGGRCGFKGANRSSYEAGYQSAVRVFKVIEKIIEREEIRVALFFKGWGQGRDALKTAILAVEGQFIRNYIYSVSDRTPIKIGGTRSKKARRL